MSSPGPERAGVPALAGAPALAELVHRLARGDRSAFAAVYDETAPAVYGVARRVLRDPDLAAEVTQEVMVELWRTAGRFDPQRGSVRAWVTMLGHRRAVDRVRSVQAQRTRDDLAAQREYSPPFDDVQETVERSMDRTRVRECLEGLSGLQRDAVVRAYYGGRSYREVAEDLDVALPTIKSRIRDGLDRLRACLGVDRDA